MKAVAILAAVLALGAMVAAGLLYLEVQGSRADSVRSSCREQNERHNETVAALDRLLDEARRLASPARRRRLEEGRASTVLLIDALAPMRDCELRVRQLLG